MKNIIVILSFFICFTEIYGQDSLSYKLDSIYRELKNKEIKDVDVKSIYSFVGKKRYPKQSEEILKLILKKTIKDKSSNLALSNASYSLGNYYFFNANTDTSFFYLNKAEEYLDSKKNPLLKSSILMAKGGVYKRKGKIIFANDNFLQALKILNNIDTLKLNDIENKKRKGKLLILYNSLAIFDKENNEFDKAIDYYNKAFKITQEINSQGIGAIILSNEGDLYIKTKQYNKALRVLEKSKKIRLSIDKNSITSTNLNLAILHTKLNNNDKALKIFNKIIPYFKKYNNKALVKFLW